MNNHLSYDQTLALIQRRISCDEESTYSDHLASCVKCRRGERVLGEMLNALMEPKDSIDAGKSTVSGDMLTKLFLAKDNTPFRLSQNSISWLPGRVDKALSINLSEPGSYTLIYEEDLLSIEVPETAFTPASGTTEVQVDEDQEKVLSEPRNLYSAWILPAYEKENGEQSVRICMKSEAEGFCADEADEDVHSPAANIMTSEYGQNARDALEETSSAATPRETTPCVRSENRHRGRYPFFILSHICTAACIAVSTLVTFHLMNQKISLNDEAIVNIRKEMDKKREHIVTDITNRLTVEFKRQISDTDKKCQKQLDECSVQISSLRKDNQRLHSQIAYLNQGNDVIQVPVPVMNVQEHLQDVGCSPGPIDGIVGPKTRQAIRTFQEKYDLEITGIVESLTWKLLQEKAKGG